MTPSMSTFGVPLTVTTTTTRTIGMAPPPASRKTVCSGERVVTRMLCKASRTSWLTGTGTAGPIISDIWMPLSIRSPRHALGQRDPDDGTDLLGELRGAHDAVGIADAPELQRIAEVARGDVVEALALAERVQGQQREAVRPRQEAAGQIDDGRLVRPVDLQRGDAVIAAAVGKRGGLQRRSLQDLLEDVGRCAHGMPPMPRVSAPALRACDAKRSFCCW